MSVFKKPIDIVSLGNEIEKQVAAGGCGFLKLDDGGFLVLDTGGLLIIGPDCASSFSPWESSVFRSNIFMNRSHLARPENV